MYEAYLVPNPIAPNEAISIDEEKCVGCNQCASNCRTQTIMPNPEKGKAPIVIYPDECWFCGCCIASGLVIHKVFRSGGRAVRIRRNSHYRI